MGGIAPLLVAGLFLFLTSCSNSRLWGQSREELFARLEERDYRFFDSVEPSRYGQVLKLGPEAPYYIGLHFSAAGKETEARAMFELGARESPEAFKRLCLEELGRIGTPAERLDAVERLLSRKDVAGAPGAEGLESLRHRLLIELGRTADFPSGAKGWLLANPLDDGLVSLFSSLPADPDTAFSAVMNARIAVFQKNYGAAWMLARALLESGPADRLGRYALSDFGKAALYGSADWPADAAFLDGLSAKAVKPETRFLLNFYAGRLYARAGTDFRARAREVFLNALELAATDTDHDSALWYLLDLSAATSLDDFFSDLERHAPGMRNPAWFSDLFDSLTVRLVGKRDWARIAKLSAVLGGQGDREIRTRVEYIAARSGALSASGTAAAFEAAFADDTGSLYYRSLAAEALGRPLGAPDPVVTKQAGREGSASAEDAERILRGYLEYKLPEKLYSAAAVLYPAMPIALAAEFGKALAASGLHGDAIRVSLLALRSSDRALTDGDLEMLYPRPWLPEVSAAASRFKVPEYLLYALIRSESYFQSDAQSGAGAVGLTQLMGPTAADIAKKLGVAEFELSDPATNITFGAYYLSEMIRRLDGQVLPALFAYNAGISRVRQWQKTAAGLPPDLFLETLPYAETREYGRKVLAAAVVYGYLYYQKTTGQVVREIF